MHDVTLWGGQYHPGFLSRGCACSNCQIKGGEDYIVVFLELYTQ